jgi:hypothetical protein
MHSLMVWERIPTHPAFEDACGVRVLALRAKVENPVILPVSVIEELLRMVSAVAVETLKPRGGVAHDDDLVGDVHQV